MTYSIETFETGNSITVGAQSQISRQTTSAKNGSYGLRYVSSNEDYRQFTKDEIQYPGDDFRLSAWVRTDKDYTNTGLTGVCFGVPQDLKTNPALEQGYQAIIDIRESTREGFQIRINEGSTPIAVDESFIPVVGIWYKIEVMWFSDGTITANLYDDTSALVSSLQTVDTTYASGMSGVTAYSESSFDDVAYGIKSTTTTPVDSGPIALSAQGAQSTQSTRLRSAQASMVGDGALLAQSVRLRQNGANMAGVGGLTAQALRVIKESAALQGTSTLTAQAGNVTIITGSVNMSAVGSVATKAQRIVRERVDMQSSSDLGASPTRLITSTAGLNGVSDLSAQATAIIAIDADLVAQGAMQAVIGAELIGTIELTGQRELHVYLVGQRNLNVNLKGVI